MRHFEYITWHVAANGADRTMEATFNSQPSSEEVALALMGMLLSHGYSAEVIAETILNIIYDERRMQDLPMVPDFGDDGLHGSIPG